MSTVDGVEMETGDFEQASFKKVANVKDNIAKYTLEAIIEKSSMNSYLLEYKEEMKRRKVLFPGFRAGKLPPYVMADVRKYLVCYGLETLMGQLCNGNGLKMCAESGENVRFGEDDYYQEIVSVDFRGYDFQKQRDTWREGTDFSFKAEFFAESEGSTEEEREEVELNDMMGVGADGSPVVETTADEVTDAEVIEK
eukprot:CAMPEP_0119043434 /NCGR_PEP_ID=MMETSP1177-20130426/21964_1 /TAXON_ID=2985 /ORGANISM="Ochromonas sp, Strain CCMP1899" /LENGTH=195 /DNA_ID=CAMNT_0007011503 /DNA_START=204 /DNA_END=791 /DNA_ORIENTATION=-